MAQATTAKREPDRPAVGWLKLGEAPLDERRGEVILVTARWVLIVVGILLTLNSPTSLVDLQISIAGILALAAVNFVLHTNLLMKRETSRTVLYWTSVGDIAAITTLAAITGGPASYAFVFYYPAILAYSLALPLRITGLLTTALVCGYTVVVLATVPDALREDVDSVASTLVTRLLTFVAVTVVANMYRWVEYKRLEDESETANSGTSPAPQRSVPSNPSIETGFAS